MSDRKPVLIVLLVGAAITLAVIFALDKSGPRDPASATSNATATTPTSSLSDDVPLPRVPTPIRRPSMGVAEFGILTDRPKAELDALVDPKAAIALLKTQHCGDAATCDAVKKFLSVPEHLRIEVLPVKAYNRPLPSDLPRVAPALSEAERAKTLKTSWVVRILVSGPPQPSQLPARGGFALAAALGDRAQGWVHDMVTDRLERPADFVKRAIVAPLDQSVFRKDRIDYQYATREGGNVRLLTAGMIRFGAPDLEVFGAARNVVTQLVDVLGALCDALASGATTSPIPITIDDIERAHNAKLEDKAAMPPSSPIDVDLENVKPESGDPNDVMARVVPPDGPSPEGYEDLAASFFGMTDVPSQQDDMRMTRDKAQRVLAEVFARYTKLKADGTALFVEIPFATTAEAKSDPIDDPDSFDFLSIEVTAFDANTVTGTIYEDPAGAFGVKKGDSVTRKRTEVTDYVLRFADGGIESASMPE